MSGIFSFLSSIIKPVSDIIDNVSTTEEERLEAQAKLAAVTKDIEIRMLEYADNLASNRTKIILAEAQGSWMQRNWRPLLMMTAIVILANNYIVVPYIGVFTDKVQILELPDGLWTLLTMGVTGYLVGRTGEKVATTFKKPQ